ncbi:Glycylpeptide N-tetradecanoyltransferase [Zalerion maritima]|uniref:Glycylpeptide N-tetradecanoyltransferase n=1 Tax=Zalerion maritima TaxID=339359 RepID=A0AAD5RI14_9PEZI|nr:Glycylpeptide N-tetradecanoyltransferase [Zalerion maritima]
MSNTGPSKDPPAEDPKGKGKMPDEVESEAEESAEEEIPTEGETAAGASPTKKKKKKSKRKKKVGSEQGMAQEIEKAMSNPLGNVPPEQLKELLTKNPALFNEFEASMGTKSGAGSGPAFDPAKAAEFMKKLSLQDVMTGLAATGKGAKDMASYKFWQTQPVPKFGDNEMDKKPYGPIKIQTFEDVPKTPLPLVEGFEWVTMDLDNEEELKEVYQLLNGHYVEDDEAMFRFNYSPSILKWAMQSPGWKKQWHIGVRASHSRKLVAFISGIPTSLRVWDKVLNSSEVNFICVHKKLRGKRLAPVLIKEVTRLINLEQVWQAIYTAGVVLPKPVSTCRYFHRAINWMKLYDVGFSPCPSGSKPNLQARKYHLPDRTATKGVRPMEGKDIDAVHDLLERYLKRFDLAPVFDKDEIKHWMLNREPSETQVVFSYVVESDDGKITDFFSFYALESSVIGSTKHKVIKAAYLWYYATEAGLTTTVKKDALGKRLNQLIHDALILARQFKFDVFNALSLMDNALFLEEQKFGPGDAGPRSFLVIALTPASNRCLLDGVTTAEEGKTSEWNSYPVRNGCQLFIFRASGDVDDMSRASQGIAKDAGVIETSSRCATLVYLATLHMCHIESVFVISCSNFMFLDS